MPPGAFFGLRTQAAGRKAPEAITGYAPESEPSAEATISRACV